MAANRLWKIPNSWRWVELGDVSEVVSKGTTPTALGGSFTATGIPFLRAEDVIGGAVDPNSVAFHIDFKTHNSVLARSQLKPGDLLITIAGSLGRVGYVPKDTPLLNCNQAVAFVRLQPHLVDVQFACFACQYEGIANSLVDLRKVGTIGNLNLQQIREFRIPLPSLSEQKRIVSILEKVDRLRRQRHYALELSSTYLQAVFLEIFGDPLTNPREWEIEPLGDILSIPPHIGTVTPAKQIGEQLCVRVGEVGEWHINLAQCKYVSLSGHELMRFSLLPGDIVLARAIGSESHLGKLSIMGKSSIQVVFDSHLMRLRTDNSRLLTSFLAYWLKTDGGRARFMRQARRTAVQFNINAEQISSIEIPVPPIPLQQKFVEVVEKYERLYAQQREAERQAEHLFQTLLHQAFGGELALDSVDACTEPGEESFPYPPVVENVSSMALKMVAEEATQLALPLD